MSERRDFGLEKVLSHISPMEETVDALTLCLDRETVRS